jgi:hypothetical protein
MRCKAHPRYKGILKPRCTCLQCWHIYLDKNPSLEIVREELERIESVPQGCSVVADFYRKSQNAPPLVGGDE